jgi:WD40 repeat protein
MASIFISYSRKDTDFAGKIVQTLAENDLDTWVDWKSIPKGEDWEQEIYRGIEEAETFLFLISPDSIKSEICNKEIAHAIKNNKRVVPLLVRDADLKNFFDEKPRKEISRRNWIFFRDGQDNFSKAIDETLTTIRTDYEWLKYHTGLQVKALEWQRNEHEGSFLLHRKELRDAEFQLATNTSKEPHPTDLQREYVFKSRQASDQQRRRTRAIAIGVIIALAALAVFALIQWGSATANEKKAQAASTRAVSNAKTAQANEKEAKRQASIAQARELAAVSIANLELDPDLSLHLAVQSLTDTYTRQGEDALRRTLLSPPVEFILMGHSKAVYSVAYDADGKRLVTASEDGTARIWDAASGHELMVLRGHKDAVYDAEFSPDGQLIATTGKDGTVRIWDANTGEELRGMQHDAAVNSVAFSSDGQTLLTSSDDQTARVWQVANGKIVHVLPGHTAAVLCAAFSPNGEWIATGGNDTLVKIWDAATGALINEVQNDEVVTDMAFTPDSQYVLTTGGYIPRRLDIQNAWVANEYLGGHTFYVGGVAVNPVDGRQMVTTSRDHTARIWDTESGSTIEVLRGHSETVYAAAFDPNGDHLATASEDQTVRIWNIAEWRKRTLIGHTDRLTGAAYSFNGHRIVTASEDGTIRIWDAGSGRELKSWDYPGWIASRVSFSPDDRFVITASDDGTWRIWDAATGEQVYAPRTITNIVHDARFSRDGKRIITANRDTFAYIWNADTKAQLLRLEGHMDWVSSAMFSPDGKLAVTASADGKARLWDAETGKPLRIFSGHSGLVTSAAFSSDGKRIVTSSVDNTARIWNINSDQPLHILKGHTAEVTDAAFSPDDRYVATASRDDTARLWNPDTGEEIVQLVGHTDDLRTVAFSPDGRYLLTSSFDGTARIYPVNFEDALALAQTLLSPRELTCVERVKYLHEENVCPTPTPILTPSP